MGRIVVAYQYLCNPSKVHDISELGSEGMSSITVKDSTPETSSNDNDNPVSAFQATNKLVKFLEAVCLETNWRG